MRGKAAGHPAGKACRSIAMADPRDAAAVDDDAAAVEVPPARPEFVLCRFCTGMCGLWCVRVLAGMPVSVVRQLVCALALVVL